MFRKVAVHADMAFQINFRQRRGGHRSTVAARKLSSPQPYPRAYWEQDIYTRATNFALVTCCCCHTNWQLHAVVAISRRMAIRDIGILFTLTAWRGHRVLLRCIYYNYTVDCYVYDFIVLRSLHHVIRVSPQPDQQCKAVDNKVKGTKCTESSDLRECKVIQFLQSLKKSCI